MERTLQVSQINRIIKDIVDHEIILENVKVVGEISSFSITRGTAYFVIKDADSMLNCVMFNCPQQYNIGDDIIVQGSVKYYEKGGKLSLNVYKIEIAGQGELYKQFLLMKEKLENEGLFEESHKKPIPSYIKRVGVVTSKTGAVIQDIINVRNRRNPSLDIVVYDAQVQGILAKKQIIEGIKFFDNYNAVDCIIVARGGGSLEDLQPFNEEDVARAVYNCNKPIISAVGHETDFTIIDFVSDYRAPTPSVASEIVAFDVIEAKNIVNFYKNQFEKTLKNSILDYEMILKDYYSRIENSVHNQMNEIKLSISNYLNRYDFLIEKSINDTKYRIDLLLTTLDNLNPAKILSKGYSVIKKDKIYQKDYSNININDIIEIENDKESCLCLVKDKQTKKH